MAAHGSHIFTVGSPEQVAEIVARLGGRIEAAFAERVLGDAELIAAFRTGIAAAKP